MKEQLLAADGEYYVRTAEYILNNTPYEPTWPPGLPHLLAIFMGIGGKNLFSVVTGMLLIYGVFSIFFHYILRKWTNLPMAHLVSLLIAVSPAFIHHSVAPLSHLPVALCLLVLTYVTWEVRKKVTPALLISMGIALGTAILIRPSCLVLIPILLLLLFPHINGSFWKKGLRLGLPFFLAGIMLIAWEVQAYRTFHRVVWINDANSSNFYLGNNPYTPIYKTWWLGSHDESQNPNFEAFYAQQAQIRALSRASQNDAYTRMAWEHIWQQPGMFFLRTCNRIRCFFAFDTFTAAVIRERFPQKWVSRYIILFMDCLVYLIIGVGAILGSGNSLRSKQPGRILLMMIMAYAFPYFVAFSHPTYHLPVVPLLALLAATGLYQKFPDSQAQTRQWIVWALILLFGATQLEWIWQMKVAIGP